jgi:hypothetical protein
MTSGTTEVLMGVWGSTGTDVYAVGDKGTIIHYDGTQWSEVEAENANTRRSEFLIAILRDLQYDVLLILMTL